MRRGQARLWLWVLLGLAWPLSSWADVRVEARRHFNVGMALISQGRLEEGIGELLAAYRIKPHPNVLYNIAKAQEAAGQWALAKASFERYLLANPRDAREVRAWVERLGARLAQLESSESVSSQGQGTKKPRNEPNDNEPNGDDPSEAEQRLAAVLDRLERATQRVEASVAPAPAAVAAAAPPEESTFELPYEETVVAASRRSQSTLDAPNSITVITGDEIRASGLLSVPELLRRVPGAEVMAMGASSHNVSFRGFNQRIANKVLLLIDGRTEYQDFLGLTFWPALPIGVEEIERVEVIRGPGSALYGSNAMLGVVNIVTRKPGAAPRAQGSAFAGNGRVAGGSVVASGGEGLTYRASVGYQQGDKFSRDYASGRPDVAPTVADDELGYRSLRGALTTTYAPSSAVRLSASGGVSRLATEVYAIGLLRNFWLDGLTGFAKADVQTGPVKFKFFWNHSNFDVGPQYEPIGQRSLVTSIEANVFDAEALFQEQVELAGTHAFAVGVSTRLKRLAWDYLGPLAEELHFATFAQDEWRPFDALSLVGSYRLDRHPLLDNGQPGYAHSPRLSAVFHPDEGHAIRGSVATAFRQPSFLESYMDLRTPVPGVNGASVLTQGNRALRPERLLSFEVGYRGEVARQGLSWDLAGYWNTVSDLVVLSQVTPVPVAGVFDGATSTFLLGRSSFVNDAQTYIARGVEWGGTWNAFSGFDVRLSGALEQVVPATAVDVCGPCTQAPALKVHGGFSYRSQVNLDVSAEVSIATGTTWVEREPDVRDATHIINTQNSLPAYAVVNARVAYRFLGDRLSVAVVGSQLGPTHQEHPLGNDISRRVFVEVMVQP